MAEEIDLSEFDNLLSADDGDKHDDGNNTIDAPVDVDGIEEDDDDSDA
jgi:hypothetical protein